MNPAFLSIETVGSVEEEKGHNWSKKVNSHPHKYTCVKAQLPSLMHWVWPKPGSGCRAVNKKWFSPSCSTGRWIALGGKDCTQEGAEKPGCPEEVGMNVPGPDPLPTSPDVWTLPSPFRTHAIVGQSQGLWGTVIGDLSIRRHFKTLPGNWFLMS